MGKKIVIPGADFSANAIIFNGIEVVTVDGSPTTAQFYHIADSSNPGVIITVQSEELTKFPENTSGVSGYLDAIFYQKPIKSAVVFYDGSYSLVNGFMECSQLESVKIDGVVQNAGFLFKDCGRLKDIYLDKAAFETCTSGIYMFYGCSSLLHVDLSNKIFSALNAASHMFHNCTSLLDVSLPNGMFDNCTAIDSMFTGSTSLHSINFGIQDFSNITTSSEWLTSCPVNRVSGVLTNIGKLASTFGIGGTSRYDSPSMDVFINGLYDNSGGDTAKKFYMSQYNSDNLTTAQRNAIAAKNWEIMIASA